MPQAQQHGKPKADSLPLANQQHRESGQPQNRNCDELLFVKSSFQPPPSKQHEAGNDQESEKGLHFLKPAAPTGSIALGRPANRQLDFLIGLVSHSMRGPPKLLCGAALFSAVNSELIDQRPAGRAGCFCPRCPDPHPCRGCFRSDVGDIVSVDHLSGGFVLPASPHARC